MIRFFTLHKNSPNNPMNSGKKGRMKKREEREQPSSLVFFVVVGVNIVVSLLPRSVV
jgi:hypothetical protein